MSSIHGILLFLIPTRLLFDEFISLFFVYLKKIRDNREKFSKLRTIFLNKKRPEGYEGDEPLDYASNRMVTSKVNIFISISKQPFFISFQIHF